MPFPSPMKFILLKKERECKATWKFINEISLQLRVRKSFRFSMCDLSHGLDRTKLKKRGNLQRLTCTLGRKSIEMQLTMCLLRISVLTQNWILHIGHVTLQKLTSKTASFGSYLRNCKTTFNVAFWKRFKKSQLWDKASNSLFLCSLASGKMKRPRGNIWSRPQIITD